MPKHVKPKGESTATRITSKYNDLTEDTLTSTSSGVETTVYNIETQDDPKWQRIWLRRIMLTALGALIVLGAQKFQYHACYTAVHDVLYFVK